MILGLECSGEIAELGPNCTSNWKVGAKVMCLLKGGGYAEYVTTSEQCVMAIPEGLNWEVAAGIPETYLTAFQLLHLLGSLTSSDVVLIHAAASGVGTAALNLCKLAGAKAIGTVGSADKVAYCKNLGAAYCFDRHDGDFAPKVKKACDEMKVPGVTLILDCVGASYCMQNFDVIAMEGRWILFGLMGGAEVSKFPLGLILRKRVSLIGTTLRARNVEYQGALVKRFSEEVLCHFKDKPWLLPVIHKVFPLSEVAAAHTMMESNANSGKIVMTVDPRL
eukprot:CAMPEP_0175092982 /NCGR_PEP_ID=MMETSP0086_2-20121207/2752_1 /TAXON_ID=136419 /ORGANISM="Unknown Unknown, Strain D1" /LENGTH=277 /DNA_ID=CAMNT_0016365879 /DNA_START=201 /DNA_END=1034 /DNA_ORIENTATION=+